MNFIDQIVSKIEQNRKTLGQVECSFNNVCDVLSNMMSSMGMSNPTSIRTRATKGVKITKKGSKYTLTLYMYNPPVVISWSDCMSPDKLIDLIEEALEQRKNIAFMNVMQVNSQKVIQLALTDSF